MTLTRSWLSERYVKIEPMPISIPGPRNDPVTYGLAMVAVAETLKGHVEKELTMKVESAVDPHVGAAVARVPRIDHEGDTGIWGIRGGEAVNKYGSGDKASVDKVKQMLNDLDKRVWSEPVGGIAVWAGLLMDERELKLVFAAKNVSKEVVYLPKPGFGGSVSIVARDLKGKEHPIDTGISSAHSGTVYCTPLQPHEVVYPHRTVNYESYRLPPGLPDGAYTIRISLANPNQKGGMAVWKETPVEAWKGKAVSPPVAFTVRKGVIEPVPELQPGQDVEFKAAYDGSAQKYILRLPEGFDASRPHDLMIGLHGHGADRFQYADDPRGECKGARDVAARHGMIFVSPDYRAASWMGTTAEADMVQLIGDLKKQYKIGKVYLVGGSMGGAAVLTFTALHPELVDGVSSQNGLANLLEYTVDLVYVVSIQQAIKDSFGGRKDETPEQFKKRDPDAYKKRSAEFHADKFTMPISFTVGEKDALVPPASVLRFAQAVKKFNKRVWSSTAQTRATRRRMRTP